MSGRRRDRPEPIDPALRPQFGLRAMTLSLVAVSLTFALSRWLPAAVVLGLVFAGGLIVLHLFSTTLGRKLRASRPDERTKRKPATAAPVDAIADAAVEDGLNSSREPDSGELGERRSVASVASWTTVLAASACIGAACGWSYVADAGVAEVRSPGLIVPAIGLAACGFLGAVAGGLSHALAASLFVAHRQSVQASEAEGPKG
ncbi:MAG TPA: hypothetical protein VGN57_12640 [Pirellulaceae bacterium]|nr:hypothetical protein [Pirellulaceae bacterium]